jgi:glycerophosphoryl diester phosphodiesterase
MTTRSLATAALLLAGCDQFTKVQGEPLPQLGRPIVLMHRGGGLSNPPGLRQNTTEAILYGASLYDGAEMDLQLSHDHTIWLAHDNQVEDCSDVKLSDCFQDLSDLDIDTKYAYCDTATHQPCAAGSGGTCVERYTRLEPVLQRFSTDPALLPKLLALDAKDQLCGSTGLAESRDMADALDPLVRDHHMDWRLFVESDQTSFMDEFHSNGTPTYLFVEGYGGVDPIIEDAARENATGISYRYYNEPYDPTFTAGLRNVGLRVIVWAVPDPLDDVEVIAPVYGMNPDVILTDRNDFYEYAPPPQPF